MMNSLRLRNLEVAPAASLHPAPAAEAAAEGEFFAFPLSPAQERMWRASLEDPGNPSYNGSFRWNLEGPLDAGILEQALNEIVRRHEILRATFVESGGETMQLIAPTLHVSLARTDLRALCAEDREREVDSLSAREARSTFDLAKGPLIRVGLLQLEDQRHILLLTIHQLVCDGWSVGLIMEELQKIYTALAEGGESPLPPLAVQYPDYVIWQREQAAGDEAGKQIGYWKKKLADCPHLQVASDFPRPAILSSKSNIVSQLLPRSLTDALKEFSTQQGGTMFITTLAACLALLRGLTGQDDLAVGSPLAGRNRTDLESLVGQFVNHVVFRADAAGDPLFPEFASRVRDTVWEAFANQDVPFENVLLALRPDKASAGEPFYSINFICQREYGRASTFVFDFAGVRLSTLPSKSQGALYDLNFFLVEREVGWRLSLEYRTDLYRKETASTILDHFRTLLEAVAADPQRRLSQLSPSFDISVSGVDPCVTNSSPATPADAISSDVEARDDASAVEIYAMPASPPQQRFWLLEKLAPGNQAFYMPACLRLKGTLSRQALEKAFQFLIRRHETLRTTFDEIKGKLMQVIVPPGAYSLPLMSLEQLPEAEREARAQDLIREEAGEAFDLVRGPLWRARLFRLSAQEHVLVVTIHHILADGWSHGVLQRELWAAYEAISQGHEPVLPALPIQYSDFTTWQQEWLNSDDARRQLDFWTQRLWPPLPVLDFPVDRPPLNRPASHGAIETLLLPEALTSALRRTSRSQEVTMFTLMLACFGALLHRYTDQEDVVIGSPVANRRPETESLIGPFSGPVCLRLDLSGNPTVRELLHRVREMTLDALSHTDLPFEVLVEKVEARSLHGRNPLFQFYFMYQTAFLQPRHLGELTVAPMPTFSLGTPFELQLGFIEREEGVRAQLEYNPDLYDAGTIQGVLDYFVGLLRTLVLDQEKHLSDLPTPKRQRTAGQKASASVGPEFLAPQDSTELQLLLMWERLLQHPGIGIRDNFFELGGQSLLAARLVVEIEKAFGKKIHLSTLLTAPTIEQLARHLEHGGESEHPSLVPIRPSGAKPPLYCVHGGGGHVLRFREMAARLDANQPFYGLRSPEADGAVKKVTVEDLAARYIKDIRTVQGHGPYNLAGASFGGLVAYEMACQLVSEGEEIAVLALFDTGNPAYYRDLPFSQAMRFHATYLLERFQKYGRLLAGGKIWESVRELWDSVRVRAGQVTWGVVQKIYRFQNRPMPTALRDNVRMFDAVARAYTPKTYPGRMTLFRAAGRTAEYGSDPALGWDAVVRGKIDVRTVPGDHMTILEEPYVWNLVEQLGNCLEEARRSGPSAGR